MIFHFPDNFNSWKGGQQLGLFQNKRKVNLDISMTIHELSNKCVSNLFQKMKAILKIKIAQKFVLVSCANPSTDWYAKKKISRQFQFWERGPVVPDPSTDWCVQPRNCETNPT